MQRGGLSKEKARGMEHPPGLHVRARPAGSEKAGIATEGAHPYAEGFVSGSVLSSDHDVA